MEAADLPEWTKKGHFLTDSEMDEVLGIFFERKSGSGVPPRYLFFAHQTCPQSANSDITTLDTLENKKSATIEFYRRVFRECELVLLPFVVYAHWYLLVYDPSSNSAVSVDSGGETSFITSRHNSLLDTIARYTDKPRPSVRAGPAPHQDDGSSCGVYVALFALLYLKYGKKAHAIVAKLAEKNQLSGMGLRAMFNEWRLGRLHLPATKAS